MPSRAIGALSYRPQGARPGTRVAHVVKALTGVFRAGGQKGSNKLDSQRGVLCQAALSRLLKGIGCESLPPGRTLAPRLWPPRDLDSEQNVEILPWDGRLRQSAAEHQYMDAALCTPIGGTMRQHERYPTSIPCTIMHPDGPITGLVTDISYGGLGVQVNAPWIPGQFRLQIESEDLTELVCGTRNVTGPVQQAIIHARFVEVTPVQRLVLMMMIAELDAQEQPLVRRGEINEQLRRQGRLRPQRAGSWRTAS